MRLYLIPFLLISGLFTYAQTLDESILEEMTSENLPSFSGAIIKDGEVVWYKSYGYENVENQIAPDEYSVYLMASVSKTFTATAAMQLVENGSLDLNVDINTYLPFSVRNPNHSSTPITAQMLITHTSSILDADVMDNYYFYEEDPQISLSEVSQRYFDVSGSDYSASNNFSTIAPGAVYEYSNIATALLAYVVEVIANQDFMEYCDENIFNVLCMENSSWRLSDYNMDSLVVPYQFSGGSYAPYQHYTFADFPNGGLRSNIYDLSRYVTAYLNGGEVNGNRLLASATIDEMFTLQAENLDPTQGISWYQEDYYSGNTPYSTWTHNGGEDGVSADIVLLPDHNIGLIGLSNGEGANTYIMDYLLEHAFSLVPEGNGPKPCGEILSVTKLPSKSVSGFPNPTDASFSFTSNFEFTGDLKVYNALGQLIQSQSNIVSGQQIDLSDLKTGVYFVELKDTLGVYNFNVVKN
jgi:CubicO group peptidase (beta-lactamase class C family)